MKVYATASASPGNAAFAQYYLQQLPVMAQTERWQVWNAFFQSIRFGPRRNGGGDRFGKGICRKARILCPSCPPTLQTAASSIREKTGSLM